MSMAPPQQQNLRIIAQRSLGKIQEYPKWLVFQLASIIIVTFFVVVALICFLAAWKPSHDARSEVRLSESTNSTASRLVRPLLKGNINQTSIQAYAELNKLYGKLQSQERYLESFYYGEAYNGIIALNVSSLNLNPSDQTLYLSITGRPFGPITYRGNSDLLALAFPTATPGADPTLSTMGQSCSVRTARTPFCGDLTVVFGDQLLLYASGDGMARRTFGVNMEAVAPYDNYPFDVYVATGLVKGSITAQMSEHYAAQAALNALSFDKSITNATLRTELQAEYKNASLRTTTAAGKPTHDSFEFNTQIDVQLQLSPFIQAWLAEASITNITERSAIKGVQGDEELVDQTVLVYRITYRRSTFTKIFAIAIVVCMWILSVYLFVLAVDHVIVRRRPLEPDTVGYSVGMLFALPALRLLLEAPFGSYIDFLGFAWNMLLVAFAVIIYFTGTYMDHKHKGRFFKRSESEVSEVLLHGATKEQLRGMISEAMASDPGFAADMAAFRKEMSTAGSTVVPVDKST